MKRQQVLVRDSTHFWWLYFDNYTSFCIEQNNSK